MGFIGKRKTGYLISAILIVTGLVSLIFHQGPNFGIDFNGGVKIRAELSAATTNLQESNVKTALASIGFSNSKILVENQSITISIGGKQDDGSGQKIAQALQSQFQVDAADIEINEVGPSVGTDLKWTALWSILWSIAI